MDNSFKIPPTREGTFTFLCTEFQKPKKQLKDIRRFLEEHTEGFSSKTLEEDILTHISIENAIKEWLQGIEKNNTRRHYTLIMKIMFFENEGTNPLTDFVTSRASIMDLGKAGVFQKTYNVINRFPFKEHQKKTCRIVFSRFSDYLRTLSLGIIDSEPGIKQQREYSQAKNIPNEIDWISFINNLETPFDLIAEMAYIAAERCEFRLRLVTNKKNALNLDSSQVDFKTKKITFTKEQSYHPLSHLSVQFPDSFLIKLKNYVGGRKGRVFLSKENKQLYPKQLERVFEKASQKIHHKITPPMIGWLGVIQSKQNRIRNCKKDRKPCSFHES